MSVSSLGGSTTSAADLVSLLKQTAAASSASATAPTSDSTVAVATAPAPINSSGSASSGAVSSDVMTVLLNDQAAATDSGNATVATTATSSDSQDSASALSSTGATQASGGASASGSSGSSSSSTSSTEVYDSADTNQDGKVSAAEQRSYDDMKKVQPKTAPVTNDGSKAEASGSAAG